MLWKLILSKNILTIFLFYYSLAMLLAVSILQ